MFEDQMGGGTGAAVPSGQTGDQAKIDPAGVVDMLKRASQPRTSLAAPQINPQAKRSGLGANIGINLLNMFVPQIGAAVQGAVKAQKEKQINEAVNDFSVLHNAWEEMQTVANGDSEKAKQLFMQDPRVQAILGDKKKQKLIAKAFSVDWMNPEKTQNTAHFQGLQRFLNLKQAHDQMKQIQSAMSQDQPTPQPGQAGPQAGQAPAQPGAQQGGQEMLPAQKFDLSKAQQPQAPRQLTEGEAKADQFLKMWPKESKYPGIGDAEKASIAMKNVMESAHADEPKTEFQAWARSMHDEKGRYPNSDEIQAHHDANRLSPVAQLIQDGIELSQAGDQAGAQKVFELAHQATMALKPPVKKNMIDLIHGANTGNAEDKRDLSKYMALQDELREAYGRGRAKYLYQPYMMPDGSLAVKSGLEVFMDKMNGRDVGTPSGRLTTQQEIAIQRLQQEAGPSGTKDYNTGAIKGVYEHINAYDSAKNRAMFAKAWAQTKPSGDFLATMHNVLNNVAIDQLDDDGKKLYVSLNRLAETMGAFRAAMGLPSTDQSMSISLNLIPGAQTPDSKTAKMQLNQLDPMIKNAWVPAYGKQGETKAKPKQSLQDYLKSLKESK